LSTKDDEYALLVADLEVYLLILSELKVIHFQKNLACTNAPFALL
jgi:hypothetical protein